MIYINSGNFKINAWIDKKYNYFKAVAYNRIVRSHGNYTSELVNDCVQDGIIKGLAALKKGSLKDMSNLTGWFSQIIRNTFINDIVYNDRYLSEYTYDNNNGEELSIIDAVYNEGILNF